MTCAGPWFTQKWRRGGTGQVVVFFCSSNALPQQGQRPLLLPRGWDAWHQAPQSWPHIMLTRAASARSGPERRRTLLLRADICGRHTLLRAVAQSHVGQVSDACAWSNTDGGGRCSPSVGISTPMLRVGGLGLREFPWTRDRADLEGAVRRLSACELFPRLAREKCINAILGVLAMMRLQCSWPMCTEEDLFASACDVPHRFWLWHSPQLHKWVWRQQAGNV